MRVIGLTGLIGSGKSAVADEFSRLGAAVIDTDILAREAVAPGTTTLRRIIELFGPEAGGPAGLNRPWVAGLIFRDPSARTRLELVLHPEIRRLFQERLHELEHRAPPPELVVGVIPLLFKARAQYPEVRWTVAVLAPDSVCQERIEKRDHLTPEIAAQRIKSQLSSDEQEKLADFVIRNTGSCAELRSQVEALYHQLLHTSNLP